MSIFIWALFQASKLLLQPFLWWHWQSSGRNARRLLLLGLIESLGAGYIGELTGSVFGSNYQDIFAFLVLILVLVLRPMGLLGEKISDRA